MVLLQHIKYDNTDEILEYFKLKLRDYICYYYSNNNKYWYVCKNGMWSEWKYEPIFLIEEKIMDILNEEITKFDIMYNTNKKGHFINNILCLLYMKEHIELIGNNSDFYEKILDYIMISY